VTNPKECVTKLLSGADGRRMVKNIKGFVIAETRLEWLRLEAKQWRERLILLESEIANAEQAVARQRGTLGKETLELLKRVRES